MSKTVLIVFTAFSFVAAALPARAQSNYRLVAMDPLTPVYDINDEGVAVGFYVFGDTNGNSGFKWTDAGGAVGLISNPADFNKFPYFGSEKVLGVNNGGTVVGQGSAVAAAMPFVPTVLSPAGVLEFLPPSETPSVSATARSVNDAGAVVGKWRGNDQTAFYWTEATGIEAISPGPSNVFYARDATDINEAGVVVGWCSGTECGSSSGAYVWSKAGGHLALPKVSAFSAAFHEALAINDRNQVVGRYIGGGGVTGVFFWSSTTGTIDLIAPAGLPLHVDINNRGHIVATITSPESGTDAYLFRNGVWTNLNDLLPPGETFVIDTVRAINNNGWIVGSGSGPLLAGFVLIPPTVDMTANGSDGPLTQAASSPLDISLAFDAGNGGLMNPAEVYIGIATSAGVFWLTPSGFTSTPTRLYAGPLPNFGPVSLFAFTTGLAPGPYVWITIVDNDTNGSIEGHFLDYVVTTIPP